MDKQIDKQKSFSKGFFSGGYFVLSIAIAVVLFAFLVMMNRAGVLSTLFADKNKLIFFTASIGYVGIIALIIAGIKVCKGGMSSCSSIPLASLLLSVFYLVYMFAVKNVFSLGRLIFAIILFLYGIIFLILAVKNYSKETKHSDCYLCATFSKFSIIAIFAVVVLIVCADYLAFSKYFKIFDFGKSGYVLLGIALLIILASVVLSASSDKIVLFDTVFAATYITVPVFLFKIAYGILSNTLSTKYIILYVGLIIAILFLFVMRMVNYDKDAENTLVSNKKSGFGAYLSKVNNKFGILHAIAFGVMGAICLMLVFPYYNLFNQYSSFGSFVFDKQVAYVALAVLDLIVLISVVIAFALSIVNMCAGKTTYGDFATFAFIGFAFYGLLINVVIFSKLKAAVCLLALTVAVAIALSRTKKIKAN